MEAQIGSDRIDMDCQADLGDQDISFGIAWFRAPG
jgi:hypothetical protein